MTTGAVTRECHAASSISTQRRIRARAGGWFGALAACAVAAGVAHAFAAGERFEQSAGFGASLLLLSIAQLTYAAVVLTRPNVALLKAGGLVCLAVLALWVISQTAGPRVVPAVARAEPVGPWGVIASTAELLTLAATVAALRVLRVIQHGCRLEPESRASLTQRIVPNSLPPHLAPRGFDQREDPTSAPAGQ